MLPILPGIAETFGVNLRSDPTLLRAQILDLPLQLLEATAPVALNGVVADAGAAGQVRVTTPIGDVQLRLANEIPVGRAVQIVIRPGARLEAFLLPAPGATAPATAAPTPAPTPVAAAASGLLAPTTTKPEAGAVPGAPASVATSAAAPVVTAASSAAAPGVAVAPLTPAAGGEPTNNATPVPTAVRLPTPPTLSPASILATLGMAEMPEAVSAGGTPYVIATPAPTSELVALVTDMRRLVAARDPALGERLVRRLPGTDRAGGLALATLPVAAQRNALAAWFGHAIKQTLDAADAGNLLEQLTSGLTSPPPREGDATEADWHWRQLPVVDHGQIYPVLVGAAPDRDEPQPDGNTTQRQRPRVYEFAVEVSLSSLGRTRIDATYQQRRLDLVIQCETEIDRDARERIVTAIAGVFDEFGLGGSCRFEPPAGAAAAAVKV
ncbi:MAG TPA: hypothetical protein VMQ73_26460 [Methylomirabilota bacterium]|nr:hypothetical protein [Methylomirabilota bacterium]